MRMQVLQACTLYGQPHTIAETRVNYMEDIMQNTIIANLFATNNELGMKFLSTPFKEASTFDLKDFGNPRVEAQVCVQLLDIAYREIVNILNSDSSEYSQTTPLVDLSKMQTQEEECDSGTKAHPMTDEDRLDFAVGNAACVFTWLEHLSRFKGEKLGYLVNGGEIKRWEPVDPADTELALICERNGRELAELQINGDNRIHLVTRSFNKKTLDFGEWLNLQISKRDIKKADDVSSRYIVKLHMARKLAGDSIKRHEGQPIDTVKARIFDWANGMAYENSRLTRLEEAVQRAANNQWQFQLVSAIERNTKIVLFEKFNSTKYSLFCYSNKAADAKKEFVKSQEAYDMAIEMLDNRRIALIENRVVDARKLNKQYLEFVTHLDEELQEDVRNSSEMALLDEVIATNEQTQQINKQKKELTTMRSMLEIKKVQTQNTLAMRALNKEMEEMAKQHKALADLLAPPKAEKAKTTKAKAKAKTAKALKAVA